MRFLFRRDFRREQRQRELEEVVRKHVVDLREELSALEERAAQPPVDSEVGAGYRTVQQLRRSITQEDLEAKRTQLDLLLQREAELEAAILKTAPVSAEATAAPPEPVAPAEAVALESLPAAPPEPAAPPQLAAPESLPAAPPEPVAQPQAVAPEPSPAAPPEPVAPPEAAAPEPSPAAPPEPVAQPEAAAPEPSPAAPPEPVAPPEAAAPAPAAEAAVAAAQREGEIGPPSTTPRVAGPTPRLRLALSVVAVAGVALGFVGIFSSGILGREPETASTPGAGGPVPAVAPTAVPEAPDRLAPAAAPFTLSPALAPTPVPSSVDPAVEPSAPLEEPPAVEPTVEVEPAIATGIIAAPAGFTSVNVRSQPSMAAKIVRRLPNGTGVEVLEGSARADGFRWVRIQVDGTIGWVVSTAIP